jgi:hypothetical protein
MAAINIQRAEFHGEWNYTISPDAHRRNRAFISWTGPKMFTRPGVSHGARFPGTSIDVRH